eukprot:scaffold1982_cov93-Amphora_coffeaeformis.AAC.49
MSLGTLRRVDIRHQMACCPTSGEFRVFKPKHSSLKLVEAFKFYSTVHTALNTAASANPTTEAFQSRPRVFGKFIILRERVGRGNVEPKVPKAVLSCLPVRRVRRPRPEPEMYIFSTTSNKESSSRGLFDFHESSSSSEKTLAGRPFYCCWQQTLRRSHHHVVEEASYALTFLGREDHLHEVFVPSESSSSQQQRMDTTYV